MGEDLNFNNCKSDFAKKLWEKFKNNVKGKVYCGLDENTLIVSVKYDDIKYEERFGNVDENILYGNYTVDKIYNTFIHSYRNELNRIYYKKHFYEGGKPSVAC